MTFIERGNGRYFALSIRNR